MDFLYLDFNVCYFNSTYDTGYLMNFYDNSDSTLNQIIISWSVQYVVAELWFILYLLDFKTMF